MKTVVVNLFAGAGAGKTTCAWEIASKLKKRGYITEYVAEYAKELVWDKKPELLVGTLENQTALYTEQKHRIDRLLGQVDFIVTDSPTLLNISYLKDKNQEYEKKVTDEFSENENFCIFIQRSGKYETAGRIHTEAEAIEKDKEIKILLKEKGIFFGTYTYSTIDTCIDNMVRTHNRINAEEKKVSKTESQAFYNLEKLKEIPIAEVAENLGIEVLRKSGSAWCKLHEEKTASCKLYETTNTFCDFGDCNQAGDTIDFVARAKKISTQQAMEHLAAMFGVLPENKVAAVDLTLSNRQYANIGIAGELATMNFDLDLEKYGVEKTKAFSEKYRMTVNELKKAYPKVYENMIRSRAFPFVYDMRQQYYQAVWNTDAVYRELGQDILTATEIPGEMRLQATECNTASQTLQTAIKDTQLKYSPVECEVTKDIEKIRSGEISFEIGNIPYFDLKKAERKEKTALCFQSVSAEQYKKVAEQLGQINYSAFVKSDKVNIAYRKEDAETLKKIISTDVPKIKR